MKSDKLIKTLIEVPVTFVTGVTVFAALNLIKLHDILVDDKEEAEEKKEEE